MIQENGLCDKCGSIVSLTEIQKGRCSSCGENIDPWEINFAGDLHTKIERKIVSLDSD